MRCPKCQFDHELQRTECLKCGIVFAHYQPAPDASATPPAAPPDRLAPQATIPPVVPAVQVAMAAAALSQALSFDACTPSTPADLQKSAAKELKYRLLALPLALLLARLLTGTGFDMAAGMLAMIVHESGHAITSWFTGRWAVPMLWVTMHGDTRSWLIVSIVVAAIGFGGFVAWKTEHWGWVCAAVALLIFEFSLQSLTPFKQEALIVFGGDGGAMVLATILMATFYAPRDGALYKSWGLRWGLLAIGALAFMHVFRLWSGPYENIPFGEIEGVNLSDPSLLTTMYGWSILQLVDRYLLLAKVCFSALAAIYAWGLVSAYLETRSLANQKEATSTATA
ncbi:MAG TPA: hypothetical protein VJN69_11560 [Candidatus Acidoferrales bacterium]|nr:hypothetical protein [Candidatus Acidoferrales bacterium]